MVDKIKLNNKIFMLILIVFTIVFPINTCFAEQKDKKYVLLIESYPFTDQYRNKSENPKEKIKAKQDGFLVTEYIDSDKINDKKYMGEIVKSYSNKYNGDNLHLVIACDINSFNFINDLDSYLIPKKYIWNCIALAVMVLIIITIIVLKNVNKRRNIEKLLKENQDQIKSIINATPDIICFKDENGRYIEVNEAYKNFLGHGEAINYKGKTDNELLEIKPECKEYILKFIESDKMAWQTEGIWRDEEKFINKEGICKVFDVIKVPTYNKDGSKKVLGIIGRDVTERRINEELRKTADENIKLLEKAKEYDKVKTEFFANVSHELRTPLNVMLSSFQLIQLYINNGSVVDNGVGLNRRIEVLKQNSLRLLKLINNLIDITKIDSGFYEAHLKNYNIVSLIEETTLSVAEYMESKGIDLVFDTEVEEKTIACDPEKVERIMLNLLSNAAKFTPSGGKVDVRLFDRESRIIISVKDTGIGIPKDKQHLIFERFKQVDKSVKKNYEGSGIGLSLVKSLVEIHNGTISVKSEYGKGSEFIIDLPCRIIDQQGNIESIKEVNKDMIGLEFSDLVVT